MGQTRKRRIVGGDPHKCIFIHLGYNGSGLGNQLFVYAAGVAAKMKTGHKLCMHWSSENPHSSMDYRPLLLQGESVDSNDSRIQFSTPLHRGLNQYNTWSNEDIPANSTDYYMHGSMYHTYQPIKKALPIIRKDFKKVFAEKYPNIKISPESAFVHVRRGDYLRVYSKSIQSVKYYKKGVEMLKDSGIKDIYVVSDDLKWCKRYLKDLIPFEGDELQTLYLMSMCKAGAVLSASTFSGWGAMLGPDENKKATIVYPSEWLGRSNNPHGWPSWWTAI